MPASPDNANGNRLWRLDVPHTQAGFESMEVINATLKTLYDRETLSFAIVYKCMSSYMIKLNFNQAKRRSWVCNNLHVAEPQCSNFGSLQAFQQEFSQDEQQAAVRQWPKLWVGQMIGCGIKPSDLTTAPVAVWVWGKPGSGKSMECVRRASIANGGDSFARKDRTKWGDDCEAPVWMIDEITPIHSKKEAQEFANHLKKWTDRYAFRLEKKGGYLWARPTHIYITSQYPIEAVFYRLETVNEETGERENQEAEALKRRIRQIHFVPAFRYGTNMDNPTLRATVNGSFADGICDQDANILDLPEFRLMR